ncbi:hypothetical protein HDV02_000723 [Globomyces sp. JEL0801]|nr:hypothetical protein HDV02_000723 [Globomyces sp. JEL0801]
MKKIWEKLKTKRNELTINFNEIKRDEMNCKMITVRDHVLKRALLINTMNQTQHPWEIQISSPISISIQKGDAFVIELWIRCDTFATTTVTLEQNYASYEKLIHYTINNMNSIWTKYEIPFVASFGIEKGQSQLVFFLGYGKQTFELGQVRLIKHTNSNSLPPLRLEYDGMHERSPWRLEAEINIEKYRKSNLSIVIKDQFGQPIPNVNIKIRMKKHQFLFGTSIRSKLLLQDQQYQDHVKKYFNTIVFENELKWHHWIQQQSNQDDHFRLDWTKQAMEWCLKEEIAIRGHTLVWGNWDHTPHHIPHDERVYTFLKDFIKDIVGTLKGQIIHWDVLNELFQNQDYIKYLGKESIIEWLKLTKELDTKTKTYLNDYPVPDWEVSIKSVQDTIEYIQSNHGVLDGLGIQGHVNETPWSIPQYLVMLNRFHQYNLSMVLSEFDTIIKDQELEAMFLKDMLIATFSHPSMIGFLTWGFWDNANWRNQGLFFNLDWTAKPTLKVYDDLVFNKWWSNCDGYTDLKGVYDTRVFQGEFEVHVQIANQTKIYKATVGKDDLSLDITIN